LGPKPYERNYFETDTVHVKTKLSFEHLSKTLSMSIEELEILNPTYKRGVIPKNYNQNKPNILRLPKFKTGVFVSNEKDIYRLAEASWNSREKQNPELQKTQPVRSRYRVRSGDYLGKIAQRYGVSISNLRRWNNLKSNTIRVGQSLVVYGKKTNSASQKSFAQSGSVKKVHVVKQGESLWKIARMYKDISIDKLKIWNELKTTQIKPGMQLKVCKC
jgi:membrane-bound lytic murein transglycosylase D